MHDFDQERSELYVDQEREFKIAGQTFSLRQSVRPEVIAIWEELPPDAGSSLVYSTLDRLIKEFLVDDGSRERWDEVRAQEEDPITVRDLWQVWYFVLENNVRFPTRQPSGSPDGPGKNEPTSEAVSQPKVKGSIH